MKSDPLLVATRLLTQSLARYLIKCTLSRDKQRRPIIVSTADAYLPAGLNIYIIKQSKVRHAMIF